MELVEEAPSEEVLKQQRAEQVARLLEKLNTLPTPKIMNASVGPKPETTESKRAAGC